MYKMSIKKNRKDGFLSAHFGRRLKSARKELGLSVGEMCVLLDVKRNSYYKYEHGARFPKYDIMISIMDNLGVSMDYLMTGQGDMFLHSEPSIPPGCELVREPQPAYGEFDPQVQDMLYCMRLSNCAKLAVLKFFQEYRYEKADLIESEIREAKRKVLGRLDWKKKG